MCRSEPRMTFWWASRLLTQLEQLQGVHHPRQNLRTWNAIMPQCDTEQGRMGWGTKCSPGQVRLTVGPRGGHCPSSWIYHWNGCRTSGCTLHKQWLQSPRIDSLTYGIKAILVGKTKNPLKLPLVSPLLTEKINQNQNITSWREGCRLVPLSKI